MSMPDELRHAKHVGNPDPRCAVCVEKARDSYWGEREGWIAPSSGVTSVRAVGGFVKASGRIVGA